ncbi:hypothetical protein L6164_021824 [Bauhinia variegata]|uniref:Uncharacterized protein n=1 Tax=Bauhinia variegata TaxID=167791 RepID=A0ACB9MF57_BAUVA|nr:hypothetical protein L6164_021824 [Bauhinia variegata]
MAVRLNTEELFLPHKDDDIPSQHQIPTTTTSPLKLEPQVLPPHLHRFDSHLTRDSLLQTNDKDEDFIAEFTRQMAHFMFRDDHQLSFSSVASDKNLEMSWDSMDSPQSTLWPPLGSPEGPLQESSPPATPANSKPSCAWDTQRVLRMFEKKINLDERGHSKHSNGNGIQSSKDVNVSLGLCSNRALIDQQIRAIQERVQRQKGERQSRAPAHTVQSPSKQQIQQFHKKGQSNGGTRNGNGRRARPTPPALFSCNTRPQQQGGSGMRAVLLGGSSSRSGSCGTGVFFPGGSSAPSEPRKKTECSSVLIPARVVQALQQHFDQMAATRGPKGVNFPTLHDVVVSGRDGMYSLKKIESGKAAAAGAGNMQNDTNLVLPQEWTY